MAQIMNQMSDTTNIYQFLKRRNIDYIAAPINTVLLAINDYFEEVSTKAFFSEQMISFTKTIKENRNGMDAIRVNIKALDLLSPKIFDDQNNGHAKSDY